MIIHFKTADTKDESFKVNWKDVEQTVRKQFPKIKIVYSRADQFNGELAISSYRLNTAELDTLCGAPVSIQGKDFTFEKLTGEDLKAFWSKQGGHYNFCIQPRLRTIKKQQKARKQDKNEKNKRSKLSYEIAGVYYSDINKVKSKARAILNLKKDDEKLIGNDDEFMQNIIEFHTKGKEKMQNFDHFEVGVHPQYERTRCFFVVKKDGSKEDFSVSKCLQNLEMSQDNFEKKKEAAAE